VQLSRFVNNVKTTSSRLIRRDFCRELRGVYRKPIFWFRSSCFRTCGRAPLTVLEQYVEQQATPE
jgi:putative transposase